MLCYVIYISYEYRPIEGEAKLTKHERPGFLINFVENTTRSLNIFRPVANASFGPSAMDAHGYIRLCGVVVNALDLKSRGPGFESGRRP